MSPSGAKDERATRTQAGIGAAPNERTTHTRFAFYGVLRAGGQLRVGRNGDVSVNTRVLTADVLTQPYCNARPSPV